MRHNGATEQSLITNLFPTSKHVCRHDLENTLENVEYIVERPAKHCFAQPPRIEPEERRPYHLNEYEGIDSIGPHGLSHDYWNAFAKVDFALSESELGMQLPDRIPSYYEHFRSTHKKYPGHENKQVVQAVNNKVATINDALKKGSFADQAHLVDDIRQLVFGQSRERRYS